MIYPAVTRPTAAAQQRVPRSTTGAPNLILAGPVQARQRDNADQVI
jgi:hypothetical protein